ncbi:hypothetical protein DB347_20350 [Opitutaceae bacterium EW11]|nr:hypothetical protein DB347_20350 [Opitutaceae bacterium EW11]
MPVRRLIAPNFEKRVIIPSEGESPVEYLEYPELPANGPVYASKQHFVSSLADGQVVGIRHLRHYEVFFKLFQRHCERHGLNQTITRRQVAPDLWFLIPRTQSGNKPGIMLRSGWRHRGRYRFLAEALQRGESVELESPVEARKVRRAWMYYFRSESRSGRECVIELRRKNTFQLAVRTALRKDAAIRSRPHPRRDLPQGGGPVAAS